MKVDGFLSRLEKVKRTGNGTWLACCPGHEDRSPSMSVRELDDGRVLVHCFAGCGVDAILGAVGMDFDALFPDKQTVDRMPSVRRPYPAADVLESLSHESLVVALTGAKVSRGEPMELAEYDRLLLAVERIQSARSLALG